MANKAKRLDAIMDILLQNGKVQISDLVQQFHVADMTIRRDFDFLVSQGKILRTHGGAILADSGNKHERVVLEPAYITRITEQASSKQTIASAAYQLIHPNQYVFLDSGTTTLSVAKLIPNDLPCFFITNGVNIAAELLSHPFPNVIMVGGEIDLNTWSSRGTLAEMQVNNFHADIAFLGCNAISPDGNVMIGNVAETGIKHKIMSISNEIYLLADSSKFEAYSLISYAHVKDFDGIITDNDLSETLRDKLTEAGGSIMICGEENKVNGGYYGNYRN